MVSAKVNNGKFVQKVVSHHTYCTKYLTSSRQGYHKNKKRNALASCEFGFSPLFLTLIL